MEQTRRDIEAETRRAIQEIRAEVADLTVLATEKVTRKSLTERGPEAARRGGPVRAGLRVAGRRGARPLMEEIATVYARSLFEVAKEQDKLDDVRDQLGEFADALVGEPRPAGLLLLALLLDRREGGRAGQGVSGADPAVVNFLKLLIEKHRMPVLFRVRATYDALWEDENKLLPVSITSAVELDKGTVKQIGDRIAEQTGRKVELSSQVEPDILGGIVVRVGNSVLDASVRTASNNYASKSRRPRRSMQIKPDEITSILKSRIEGLDEGQADLTEVGTVLSVADGIARIHGLENCEAFEMLELPHDVTGLALNLESDNVGAVLFGPWEQDRRGRHGQAHEPAAGDPGRRGAARPDRLPARPAARRQGRHRHRARPARRSSRPPAWSSASR